MVEDLFFLVFPHEFVEFHDEDIVFCSTLSNSKN